MSEIISYTHISKNENDRVEINIERTLTVFQMLRHLWKFRNFKFPRSVTYKYEKTGSDIWNHSKWVEKDSQKSVTDFGILCDISKVEVAIALGELRDRQERERAARAGSEDSRR